jgi:hypothetical protein
VIARRRSSRPGLRRRTGRRLAWLLGVAVVLPLLAVDPAVLALLLDADFIALAGVVALALLRGDARRVASWSAVCLPVLWVRVGTRLTRERPRTLVA